MNADAVAREKFCSDTSRNFSVIAPAGVGKTRAIIDRIVAIGNKNPSDLARLVVVTYTKKAADEMHSRAVNAFSNNARATQFLQRAFFGTIHSYCFNIIKEYANFGEFSILDDDASVRMNFLLSDYCKDYFSNNSYSKILKHVELEAILSLCLQIPHTSREQLCCLEYPQLSFGHLLAFENKRTADSINEQKSILKNFIELQANENCFAKVPECNKGGAAFKDEWKAAFGPLNDYLESAIYEFACSMRDDYLRFRIERKQLLHDDIIYIARQLLDDGRYSELSHNPVSILLDEAQDTDAAQFDFLLKLFSMNAQSMFSLVGDPQQAIYGSRTHVSDYITVHKKLIDENFFEELVFNKTFRCPISVVEFINEKFPNILIANTISTQVDFVRLITPDTAKRGEILDLDVQFAEKSCIKDECEFLVNFLENFVRSRNILRSDICILSPRNTWLYELNEVFNSASTKLQLHSSSRIFRDNSVFCALLSVISIINFPQNSHEISGFLIYFFGITHYKLAMFVKSLPSNARIEEYFRIDKYPSFNGEIAECLKQLYCIYKKFKSLQLTAALVDLLHALDLVNDIKKDSELDYNSFINKILYEAAKAEGAFDPIDAFCQSLQNIAKMPLSADLEVMHDAYQAYSCHKAKGLEWPVVVIPFMARKIEHNKQRYPYFYKNRVILNQSSQNKPDLTEYKINELKRMLYVALTRARDTLVLINNSAIECNNDVSFKSILDVDNVK